MRVKNVFISGVLWEKLIDKPIQAQATSRSKDEWPASCPDILLRPRNLTFPYISAALSFLGVRRFRNVTVLGKGGCVFRFCRPLLLSVGKGGFPAPLVNKHTAGRSCCNLTAFRSAPPRQQAECPPPSPPQKLTGQMVVVSFKIKAPACAPHGTSSLREPALFNCATSLV